MAELSADVKIIRIEEPLARGLKLGPTITSVRVASEMCDAWR
jgi:hypothetical protein